MFATTEMCEQHEKSAFNRVFKEHAVSRYARETVLWNRR